MSGLGRAEEKQPKPVGTQQCLTWKGVRAQGGAGSLDCVLCNCRKKVAEKERNWTMVRTVEQRGNNLF